MALGDKAITESQKVIHHGIQKTPELSRLARLNYLTEALYWRNAGNREEKKKALKLALLERLNKRYLLDENMSFRGDKWRQKRSMPPSARSLLN
ncbi:hypothetical protein [Symbiopectobacterium purcellii]|uniref:Uncharacterized protein n=1 Tax=Symbiopectobacterium purcellii TaxID=2871826 RepID=A0ABX9AWR2_9ENTR|nr:hypothetical protein [Symbiopectobacterium purcellii]QZN98220.1 hypothetical protein K6K13_02465 [Symbiopectobacterium purcellii]